MGATGRTAYVSYDVDPACKAFSMRVEAGALTGSVGTIAVPRLGANHVVSVNGAAAWTGTSFVGASGITGAYQDDAYVYFTGVQPGVRTFAYSDGTGCPTPPEEWTFCADENASCAFTGTKRVRFGKSGHYAYGISGSHGPRTGARLATPPPSAATRSRTS